MGGITALGLIFMEDSLDKSTRENKNDMESHKTSILG